MKRDRELSGGCEVESINMAHILMLLAQNGNNSVQYQPVCEERVFECKTCNRQFPSFQALGGHRASHKKPKLGPGEFTDSTLGVLAKPKLHECSICGLEFSIGQALGGHMRRHRANNEGFRFLEINKNEEQNNKTDVLLDLNMPPSMEAEVDSKSHVELVTLKFL